MQAAGTSTGIAVELERVRRVFEPAVIVIDGFNLRVAAGEFLAILGPSGCGKSTLLRMIAGLLEPTSGTVSLTPAAGCGQTSFVFQDAHLLPWRMVLDNAALPLELMGVPKDERYPKARSVLQQVGLAEALHRYPSQLSGGMKMRVSLARALVTAPRLLLLDEPFAALDEITRFRLDDQLRALWKQSGMTVIFVTHSISEAAYLANRAVVLGRRGGRIKLDHEIVWPERDLPQTTGDLKGDLRMDPRYAREMKTLLTAMEEE